MNLGLLPTLCETLQCSKAPGGSRRFLAGHSGLALLSSYNFYQGFGLDVTEKGVEPKVGSGGANRCKEWIITKSLFCFSSCVENICSVMRAAVGLKTLARAADKGRTLPASQCFFKHIHLAHLLGLSCQLDLLASVISFLPFLSEASPASLPPSPNVLHFI